VGKIAWQIASAWATAREAILPTRTFGRGCPPYGLSKKKTARGWLRDPDDNGVELYWDRPKAMWPKREDGGLRMYTNPLDLHDLLAELDKTPA
jgi:hypothetical protein